MGGLLSVITIGIDPTTEIGPITLAWHGITIALGIGVGAVVGAIYGRNRGLEVARFYTIAIILVVASLIGGRLFFLAEHDQLFDPGEWFGTQGFTLWGGVVGAGIGIAVYSWHERLPVAYFDSVAFAFPLGLAIGRIGDVINGEHFGPATNFFLGVQNTHPDALTPSPDLAYHSGGMYEVILGAAIFLIVFVLRDRLQRPFAMTWTVLALFSLGRFLEFFVRSDSGTLALGLETAQWTSLALLAVAIVGAWWTFGRGRTPAGGPPKATPRGGT